MNTAFKEEKFKEKDRKIKITSNKFLYGFITIFLVGYTFFFTSSFWLPKSYTGVSVTPIGTSIKANDRVITVDRWVYSPNDRLMEIIVEIENNSIDGLTEYAWQLRDKNGLIKTEVVAQDDTFFVIHGKSIKKGWAEVSLTLSVNSEEETSFSPVVIYMNDKVAPIVSFIEEKSMSGYRVLAYESKIESFQKSIDEKKESINAKEDEIEEIHKRTDELVKRLEHQTEQEKDETSSLITSLSQREQSLLSEINKIKEEITEIEEKIEITKSILDGLN